MSELKVKASSDGGAEAYLAKIDAIIERFRVACGNTTDNERREQLFSAALVEFDAIEPKVSRYFAERWLRKTGYGP